MDAIKTLWKRLVDARDAVRRPVHAITGKFDIIGVFRGDPTARRQVFITLYKRCGITLWCHKGIIVSSNNPHCNRINNLASDYILFVIHFHT